MKYINLFDTQAEYDAAQKYYPNTSYIEETDEVVYQEIDPLYSSYLTFEALQNGTFTLTVPAAVNSTYMTSISYSVDDGANWSTTTIDNTAQTITTPTINAGDKVLWKGESVAMAKDYNNYSSFSSTGRFNVSGNIMSLLYGDDFENQTTFPTGSAYTFKSLFSGVSKLVSVENLVLSATTLANSCYYGMFQGCTALTVVPVLNATTLADSCYGSMFQGCTALTTAPELPVTTLAYNCYYAMFQGCSSLTTAPVLPATILADNCYYAMFRDCTALTTAPSLNATTTTLNCYRDMFNGCADLTKAPTLPANNLSQQCYDSMFYDCTSLVNAPELPATTLMYGCYGGMFYGCTSLVNAPELPATTLMYGCYDSMFNGCTSLNHIKALFTTTPSNKYTKDWVKNVAATGTFTKAASMTTLPSGASGIPTGWTVVDATA